MKKSIIIFFASFALILGMTNICWAASGAMSGEENIRVVKTQWFDIIYPERCEHSASILYENADSLYEEIAASYGQPIFCRLPVVIIPSVEIQNAYFRSYPYNVIVIYDTSVTESLNVFSNTLLSTFKHELVHAYTLNMKNGFWKFMSFFSDSLSMSGFTVSPGMAEGATVSTESADGEGRMNDEYSLQMIKQAKIENKFPGYADVRGARDVYPYGSYYYFSGAFHSWLQKKYGMEKYGKFWYLCINSKISNNSAFEETYGITYKSAWNKFHEEFPVPDIDVNPVESGNVTDFFEREKNAYSASNDSGALYANLSLTEKGLFFTDRTNVRILFVPKSDLEKNKIKPKTILKSSCQDFTVSEDGKYLLLTVEDENGSVPKLRNVLYRFDDAKLKAKKILTFDETGYFNSKIIFNGGKYYVLSNRYSDGLYSVVAKEIKFSENGRKEFLGDSLFEIKLPFLQFASDFIQIDENSFAFIKKDGLSFSICISDFNGVILQEHKLSENFDEKMLVRNLSYKRDANELLFSWVKKDTMPRLGILNLDDASLWLCDSDVSGGVYAPFALNDDLIFCGNFYLENRIFVKKNYESDWKYDEFDSSVKLSGVFSKNAPATDVVQDKSDFPSVDLDGISQKYKPFDYYKKGNFIPFIPVIYPRSISAFLTDSMISAYLTGFSWITATPWDSSNIGFYCATNFNEYGFMTELSGGTDTGAFKYALSSQSEFTLKGWLYSDFSGTLSSKFKTSPISAIEVIFSTFENIDKTDLFSGEILFYSNNDLEVSYSAITKRTSGKYGWGGFGFGLKLSNNYLLSPNEIDNLDDSYANIFNIELRGSVFIPQLLPYKNKTGTVRNFPLKIDAYLFPSSSLYSMLNYQNPIILKFVAGLPLYAFQLDSELVLLASDIQKAVSFMPIFYMYDTRLSLCFKGGIELRYDDIFNNMKILTLPKYPQYLKNHESKFLAEISLKSVIGMGMNFGSLCGASKTNFCIEACILTINLDLMNTLGFFRFYFDVDF